MTRCPRIPLKQQALEGRRVGSTKPLRAHMVRRLTHPEMIGEGEAQRLDPRTGRRKKNKEVGGGGRKD